VNISDYESFVDFGMKARPTRVSEPLASRLKISEGKFSSAPQGRLSCVPA
jgi:hypothetical protein